MRYLFYLLLTLPLALIAQEKTPDHSEAFKLIEVWLEAQKDFENLPGITAAHVHDQEVVWSAAFGNSNLENDKTSSPQTLHSICSISKLFTSVAIMKLYDEGKLRLDDKVSDLLPWFDIHQKYEASGPITVRGLLTHSAGLPREAAAAYWSWPDFPFPTRDEMITGLKEQETLYPSQTHFQYSNLGLSLLGEIVAEVSGMSYDAYVQENILDPLGLEDTRPYMPEDLYGDQLAVGYSSVDRSRERKKVKFFQANAIGPAAGYSSNVLDLADFASWQFRLLETQKTEILKSSTLQNMHNVHWTDEDFGTTWGLGFVVYKGGNGKKMVSHGGSCPGYRTTLQISPSAQTANVVMINASGTNPNKYSRGITAILSKSKGQPSDSADLSDYTGFYNSQPWWSEQYFGVLDGKLVSMGLPADNPDLTFFKHIEGDTFQRVRDDGELAEAITFERDDSGKVYRISRNFNYSEKLR
jgi:CubicO group peptidase (beta-lactamase class C family)